MITLMNGKHEPAERKVEKSAYAKLLKLAKESGLLRDGRENLDTHRMDAEDFLETSVWTINEILQAAYLIGYKDAESKIITDLKKDGVHIGKPKANLYNYEWKTAKEIIANKNQKRKFPGWPEMPLTKIVPDATDGDLINAHELWLKLKKAFNAEAAAYSPGTHNGFLGSIGEVRSREVCRSEWWRTLNGDAYGDYDILTSIIEALHDGEKLKTGEIRFGS